MVFYNKINWNILIYSIGSECLYTAGLQCRQALLAKYWAYLLNVLLHHSYPDVCRHLEPILSKIELVT